MTDGLLYCHSERNARNLSLGIFILWGERKIMNHFVVKSEDSSIEHTSITHF